MTAATSPALALPELPEPAFRLLWKTGQYKVSMPNIGDTNVFTELEMTAYGQQCAQAQGEALAVELRRMMHILDRMGDAPDAYIDPGIWRELRCEDAIRSARTALAALKSEAA